MSVHSTLPRKTVSPVLGLWQWWSWDAPRVGRGGQCSHTNKHQQNRRWKDSIHTMPIAPPLFILHSNCVCVCVSVCVCVYVHRGLGVRTITWQPSSSGRMGGCGTLGGQVLLQPLGVLPVHTPACLTWSISHDSEVKRRGCSPLMLGGGAKAKPRANMHRLCAK